MNWKLVKHSRLGKPIGALGYMDNKLTVICTFYDDRDWNYDGHVDWTERAGFMLIGVEGKAAVDVLTQAKSDPDLFMADPGGINRAIGHAIAEFAGGMIRNAVYLAYMKVGVGRACGAVAGAMASGTATRFFIKKGMERAVKAMYDAAVD